MKILSLVVLLGAIWFTPVTYAQVIVGDAQVSTFNGDMAVSLTQSISPSGGGLFAFTVKPITSSQYSFSFIGIAEITKLFNVGSGVNLDANFVSINTPLISNDGVGPSAAVLTFSLNQTRSFGYWDDRYWFNGNTGLYGLPDVADNYGWLTMTRTISGLVLSGSATAIGGGIVVGTTSQIPEPSSIAFLFGVTCFGFIIFNRRK